MPDDEETTVRRRLARLFGSAQAAAVPPIPADRVGEPGRAAGSSRRSGLSPSGPGHEAGPGLGLRPGFPERDEPPSGTNPWSAGPDADDGPSHDAPASARGLASRLPGPGAFDPGRRGVRALAAVAAVVVVVAAVWAWRSRPSTETVQPVATSSEAPVGAATDAVTGVPASGGSPGQVVVAVAGKVRRPGLVRLPAGARVADAVEAAGGALPGVDVALLNPARKVTDGELILVGVTAPPGQAAPGPVAGGGAPGGPAAPAGPLNLNTATLAQLDALPGVGPVLAQRILDHRDRHGGFRSVSDLRQVDGIGDARYEQLKELVTV
ncbi:helix-hairpin-helix domain-containing protein [Micromonospora chalcea]|uniref:helix-hairpin-helix domain-containing protein n=1 Tax=Micromonospora chalcea TaxID=1874 RepID=UPI0021A69517|nr:helix-hairpin-helix domain-containing protein [Micromonospora chalcea]MCT2279873.1 helix-hairpin-helix domain-containing protein [Micromonospora chalcea]